MASGVSATGALTVGGTDEFASPAAVGGTTGPRDFARALRQSAGTASEGRPAASDWSANRPNRSGAG